ncbi:hypothetical protein BJV78DRAFT_1284990 [Lactifluus subvellereus]|nr:hypothetical protein BJV78DRAFT_1284990 [Lactifluus subvellereus]
MSRLPPPNAVAGMLAVLGSAPHPPLGVALFGLFIAVLNGTLHLLPYILFCSMIGLSFWAPSSPSLPHVVYFPVHGHLNMVSLSIVSPPTLETQSFKLGSDLRILIFLLSIPVSSIAENTSFVLLVATGLWPDTWTPIMNALRSCEFVADFLDGVTGKDFSPSLVHEREAHAEGMQPSDLDPGVGRCDGLQTCPTEGKASPSRRAVRREPRRKRGRRRLSNSDPVSHGEQENSPNVPPKKTYISPPRVSPLSPWVSNGSGVLSPISKNLSRMVAILFHHPPLRKPVIRRRFNLKATMHSARAPNVDFHLPYQSHLWARSGDHDRRVSDGWTPMSSLGTSICNSVYEGAESMLLAWQNAAHGPVMEAPVRAECIAERLLPLSMTTGNLPGSCEAFAIESAYLVQQRYRENGQLPNVPQVPEPPIQAYSQCFVSNWQEEQPSQSQPVQMPVYHAASYQHQQPPVPVSPMAYEPVFHCSPSTLLSSTSPQHQHIDLDVPEQLMADPQHAPPAEEKCTNHASQSRSFEDTPGPVLSGCSSSYIPSVLEGALACLTSCPPEALSSTPPQVVPLSETVSEPVPSARADLYGSKWVSHQSPATTDFSPQPYVVRPFRDLQVTEPFTFNVLSHTATPYFDFSHHVPLTAAPCSQDAEPMSIRDASLDAIHASQSVIVEHAPMQSFAQNIHPPPMLSAQPPAQPQEVIPQTVVPTESAAVMTSGDAAMSAPGTGTTDTEMDADSDDDSCSDSDSSDSDSEMDSDSDSSDDDSDSDSSDDEEATATDTGGSNTQGPARNNPAKNKAPNPALDTQSTSQNAASIPNNDQSSTALKDIDGKADTDEDSDGDSEYIPPPPGQSKLADDSSSDSDMSDHEEEDRIYWEQFYTPKHRR